MQPVPSLKVATRDQLDARPQVDRPGLFGRFMAWLGVPQLAFVRNIPNPTRFFWFKCCACRKLSTDYFHGYSHDLICQYCNCRNRF